MDAEANLEDALKANGSSPKISPILVFPAWNFEPSLQNALTGDEGKSAQSQRRSLCNPRVPPGLKVLGFGHQHFIARCERYHYAKLPG